MFKIPVTCFSVVTLVCAPMVGMHDWNDRSSHDQTKYSHNQNVDWQWEQKNDWEQHGSEQWHDDSNQHDSSKSDWQEDWDEEKHDYKPANHEQPKTPEWHVVTVAWQETKPVQHDGCRWDDGTAWNEEQTWRHEQGDMNWCHENAEWTAKYCAWMESQKPKPPKHEEWSDSDWHEDRDKSSRQDKHEYRHADHDRSEDKHKDDERDCEREDEHEWDKKQKHDERDYRESRSDEHDDHDYESGRKVTYAH